MPPRRLTSLLYILLLIVAIMSAVSFAISSYLNYVISDWYASQIASLPESTSTAMQNFEAAMQESDILAQKFEAIPAFIRSEYWWYGALAIRIVVLLVSILKRKTVPQYYADHLTWQRNTILGEFVLSIVMWFFGGMMMMITLHAPIIVNGLIMLWFFYRVTYGMRQLHKEESVYHNGVLPYEDNESV